MKRSISIWSLERRYHTRQVLLALIVGVSLSFTGCATLNEGGDEAVRLKEPRIQPLAESQWNAQQQKMLIPLKRDGRVINVWTTIANNPKLAEKWLPFAFYFLTDSTLPRREREMLMLRSAWLCQCEYIFGQHTLLGKSAGLSDEEIARITKGPKAPGWNPFDATLLQAVDELHADAFIPDVTWNALAQRYNQQQLMDVVATVGQYTLLSMFLNSLGVQLDEGVPGFPTAKDK
ncbi:MAG: carboxymuconolactone decarboxylase family protein [Syntrophorhabdales bacterium]|jgi:AhpD family alkylhydroperoxidase